MILQNGACYLNANGVAVRAQLEVDGCFHCYSSDGKEVEKIPATTEREHEVDGVVSLVEGPTHVEGWVPIGAARFRESATPEASAPVVEVEVEDEPKPKKSKAKKKEDK